MSEDTRVADRWVVVATAGALLVTLGVGAYHEALPWQRAEAAGPMASPLTPIERFAVPVSTSQPKAGPEDAIVTVVEWCDFHSPGCATSDAALSMLLKAYPTQVRRVFRHFADKQSMQSLEEHELAHMAFDQAGKFVEARALLMQAGGPVTRDELQRLSATLGMDWQIVRAKLDKHAYAPAIVADRTFAQMFEVTEVPTLFVNGRRLSGEPTFPKLRALVEEELARAQQLVDSGVAKDAVYAELTKHGRWEKPDLQKN